MPCTTSAQRSTSDDISRQYKIAPDACNTQCLRSLAPRYSVRTLAPDACDTLCLHSRTTHLRALPLFAAHCLHSITTVATHSADGHSRRLRQTLITLTRSTLCSRSPTIFATLCAHASSTSRHLRHAVLPLAYDACDTPHLRSLATQCAYACSRHLRYTQQRLSSLKRTTLVTQSADAYSRRLRCTVFTLTHEILDKRGSHSCTSQLYRRHTLFLSYITCLCTYNDQHHIIGAHAQIASYSCVDNNIRSTNLSISFAN